jgi:MSHA pilin protein MshC
MAAMTRTTLVARKRARGFSLTELVVVIIIAGILAAATIARYSNVSLDTRGFTDQTLAMLRYAQKTAISQRRTVCVSIAANAVSLSYLVPPAANTTCPGTSIVQPGGSSAFSVATPSGVSVTLGGTTSPFSFSPLGQPSGSTGVPMTAAVTVTVTGDVVNTITIEQETGYVR